MNVYDFDKTIYNGDSTVDFYFYCIKKHPRILFRVLSVFWYYCLFVCKICSKTVFKEKFYAFLKDIKDIDKTLEEFWEKNRCKIKQFYLENKKEDDLVISASPEFLLNPVCKNLIASKVDKKTGKYTGENCSEEEKVCRYRKEFGDKKIYNFYSDSLSDAPLAEIAENAFFVKGERITKWNETFVKKAGVKQFLFFSVIGIINTINCILFSLWYSCCLPDTVSFAFGYGTSLIISYLLNSLFTFKKPLSFKRFVKFCLSYVPNYIIQQIMVFAGINIIGISSFFAYTIAAVIGLPVTFVIMKIFAFKR